MSNTILNNVLHDSQQISTTTLQAKQKILRHINFISNTRKLRERREDICIYGNDSLPVTWDYASRSLYNTLEFLRHKRRKKKPFRSQSNKCSGFFRNGLKGSRIVGYDINWEFLFVRPTVSIIYHNQKKPLEMIYLSADFIRPPKHYVFKNWRCNHPNPSL